MSKIRDSDLSVKRGNRTQREDGKTRMNMRVTSLIGYKGRTRLRSEATARQARCSRTGALVETQRKPRFPFPRRSRRQGALILYFILVHKRLTPFFSLENY